MKPEHRIKALGRKVGRAINRYGMMGEGDNVLVALSGGVDSLVLLDSVAGRRRRLPVSYSVTAAHVVVPGLEKRTDMKAIEDFCEKRGVSLIVRHVSEKQGPSMPGSECFLCSRYRRKELFELIREEGFNRLALGHHMDDIIETFILNMAFNARLATMRFRLTMFGGEFDLIRPLGFLTKREVLEYADLSGITPLCGPCPLEGGSKRLVARGVVEELERANPDARFSIFNSMRNIAKDYLPLENGEDADGIL